MANEQLKSTAAAAAAEAAASDPAVDVGFFETVEHLGGARVLLGGVLVLLVVYLLLVEWLLPSRRHRRDLQPERRASNAKKRR